MILFLVSMLGEMCPKPGHRTRGERLSRNSQFIKWYDCKSISPHQLHELKSQSPECNLLYDQRKIKSRESSTVREMEDAARHSQNAQDRPTPDSTIIQSQTKTAILEIQNQPQATIESGKSQDRQNARQTDINNLQYFKRAHLMPSKNKSVKKVHWAAIALTQSRCATPLKNAQRSI